MHSFKYAVFTLYADIDSLPTLNQRLGLFSHNRFNLFSLHDTDFGDGADLRKHLDDIAASVAGPGVVSRFMILCYPRVLGYAFNPLTVYYGLDDNGEAAVVVYEVSNTFGERHTYAMAANTAEDGVMRHECAKVFHVSPFNKVEGRYAFRTALPGESAGVGIRLDDSDGPLLAAHFGGTREQLTDGTLLRRFVTHAFLTQKVWLGIRYEALRLWMKGLSVFRKPVPPNAPISIQPTGKSERTRDLAA
jgi:hypothetical protein